MKKFKSFVFLCLALTFISCLVYGFTQKKTEAEKESSCRWVIKQIKDDRVRNYMDLYLKAAIRSRQSHGIPISIKLIQGGLESTFGESKLAKVGKNHFGIKCRKKHGHPNSGSCIALVDDDTDENGRPIASYFVKYENAWLSYEDNSRVLFNPRYRKLRKIPTTDYEGWAKGLKTCGYATDARYAHKLISGIEDYDLGKLDAIWNR